MNTRTALALAAGAATTVMFAGAAMAAGADDPAARPSASVDDSAARSASPSVDDSPAPDDPHSADDSSPAGAGAPSVAPNAGAGVSRTRAEQIATRAAGGGRVTKVERETEHGRAVYKIEVRVGAVEHDLYIDVATGDVLRHQVDKSSGGSASGSSSSRKPSIKSSSGRSSSKGRGSDDAAGDDHGRHSGRDNEAGDDKGGRHGSDD
jgi:hypothetical protein